MNLTVEIPGLRVQSEMNARDHWAKLNKRKQKQKDDVFIGLIKHAANARYIGSLPRLRVTMTRIIGPRGKEMDSDNLASAFKFIRDAVAAWLGRDDGPTSGIEWITTQERGQDWAIRIQISEV